MTPNLSTEATAANRHATFTRGYSNGLRDGIKACEEMLKIAQRLLTATIAALEAATKGE